MGEEYRANDDPDEIAEARALLRTRKPVARIDSASFYGSRPRSLLKRLLRGDPLDLGLRCFQRRNRLAYVIARPRLFTRAVARVAYAGHDYCGDPPVDFWLEGLIDQSIGEILEEDDTAELRDAQVEELEDFAVFAGVLGVDARTARAACVAFNHLVPDVRRAFFAVTIEGDSAETFARRERRPLASIVADLTQAVSALLHAAPETDGSALGNWPIDW